MRKKRFTNVIMAMLVVVGILTSSIEAQAKSFPDVPSDSWYAPYVDRVSNHGIMTGLSDGRFAPLENMNRAALATCIYRMAGSPYAKYQSYYTDITKGTYDSAFYGKAAIWCYERGIMTGYQGGSFGPENLTDRQEVATVLYRFAKNYLGLGVTTNVDLSTFPDADAVAPFAVDGMKFAFKYGLIKGDQGKLNPRGTVNRAVGATILCRFDENILGH